MEDSAALLTQLADALAAAENRDQLAAMRGRVLACLGSLLCRLDRGEQGVAYGRESLELVKDKADRAFALVQLGFSLGHLGRHGEARAILDEGIAAYREVGDPVGLATGLYLLAIGLLNVGGNGAQRMSRQAVELSRQTGRLDLLALALNDAAWIDCCCGDYDDGINRVREAAAIAEQLGHRVTIALTGIYMARLLWCRDGAGHPDVLSGFQRSMTIFREMGMRSIYAGAISQCAVVLDELGRTDEAVAAAREAATIARKEGNQQFLGLVLANCGGIFTHIGAYAEARLALRDSLAATYPIRHDSIALYALYYLAELIVTEQREADPATHEENAARGSATADRGDSPPGGMARVQGQSDPAVGHPSPGLPTGR